MEDNEIREEGTGQFSVQSLIKEIKRNFLLIIVIMLVCTATGGVVGNFFIKTQYESTASLIVVDSGENASIDRSQQLAATIKAFVDSNKNDIYEVAILKYNTLHPSKRISVEDLKSNLNITVNTVMIDLKLVLPHSDVTIILDTVIESIIEWVDRKQNGEYVNGMFAEKVRESSSASKSINDNSTKTFKYMALFFAIGLAGSLLFIFLKVLINDTYKDKESVEADTGIEVLAMIELVSTPKIKGGKRNGK